MDLSVLTHVKSFNFKPHDCQLQMIRTEPRERKISGGQASQQKH